MINLRQNADQIIKNLIFTDPVRSFYLSVCERYTQGYVQSFITDMQILVTKLGIVISRVDVRNIKIAYCATSLKYLCLYVLNNSKLLDDFKILSINGTGNTGKHTIDYNVTNMERVVKLYNTLVLDIINTYHLGSLMNMLVKKDSKYLSFSNAKNSKIVSKSKNVNESAMTSDERLKLKVSLTKGDGRYTKEILWSKKKMLNLKLNVAISNPDALKIISVKSYFKCGSNKIEKSLSTSYNFTKDINLDASKFNGKIQATVIIIYKIGMFKTKEIKTIVSKIF